MDEGKAEDAGGLTPAKDNNAAINRLRHRTFVVFSVNYYKGRRNLHSRRP